MSVEFFIARRIYKDRGKNKNVSPPAIRVATISIAIGLAVMILSVAVVVGFKKEIREKIIGFGSHIQISNFEMNHSYEMKPIAVSDTLMNDLQSRFNVLRVERFATKPGIIKTSEDFQGVIFKGVDEQYNWDFFRSNLIEGTVLDIRSDSTLSDVLISKTIADKLSLKLNDSFTAYFIQDPPRARKFHIAGIYQTYFSDYDKIFVLLDIKQIRRLNQWDDDMVSGLEIYINDYNRLDATADSLYFELQTQNDRLGNTYLTQSIKQRKPEIFDWLNVLDTNVVVILILMLVVAGFSMISGLLIIILERAGMIGILKALGQNNASIRKIFLYLSAFLIGKGLLWGNILALSLCLIQHYFGILKLNPEVYYLTKVPINISIPAVLTINVGALLVILAMLIGPSYVIAGISPAKTIRFE
ncbi:MAG: ABC transporter permease [Candidatus Azobacteroides sp.]|nr:ABC transporter permease [Candidatus Azobacteroides sp.]